MIRLTVLLLLLLSLNAHATLKIAVASNFRVTLNEIVTLYEQQSDEKILISSGSTGILYNQITHGAPFDLFLSADSERAKLIELSSLGIEGSRFTYAKGQLAFWYPRSTEIVNQKLLHNYKGRVAIANPKLAPYGLATKQSLQSIKKWSELSFIKGNNVTQAYQFVDTGNIDAGFVAYALIIQNQANNFYLLPTDSYQPILQQGVMLSDSNNSAELQKFVTFLQSDSIQSLIRSRGYL